jgi:hypothetical protein
LRRTTACPAASRAIRSTAARQLPGKRAISSSSDGSRVIGRQVEVLVARLLRWIVQAVPAGRGCLPVGHAARIWALPAVRARPIQGPRPVGRIALLV